MVTQTLTGAQLRNVLEQQFVGFNGQTTQRILQVSAGLTYSYDSTAPVGSRVSALAFDGAPVDPAASYRVTTNDFLANGGDGFTELRAGTDRATAPGFDVDALIAYLGAGAPVAPDPPTGSPASAEARAVPASRRRRARPAGHGSRRILAPAGPRSAYSTTCSGSASTFTTAPGVRQP